jgi:hypothetical protein
LLVRHGQCIEIAGLAARIVHPLPQGRTAVDDVDGELAELIFVREIAPQIIARVETADRLEGERLEAPRLECLVVVGAPFGMDVKP